MIYTDKDLEGPEDVPDREPWSFIAFAVSVTILLYLAWLLSGSFS